MSAILECRSRADLEALEPHKHGQEVSEEEFLHILNVAGAFWRYQGEPCAERPHVLLASGKHSDAFVMCKAALKIESVRQIAARLLLRVLRQNFPLDGPPMSELFDAGKKCWVVGSATSATALARDLADIMGLAHGEMKKDPPDTGERQLWNSPDFPAKDALIIHIEELVTTTTSAKRVREGIRREAAIRGTEQLNFLGIVPTLVWRPAADLEWHQRFVGRSSITPFTKVEAGAWEFDECPYCKAGSEAIKAKDPPENWERLNAA